MRIEKETVESAVYGLLKTWCDTMLDLQLDMPGKPAFDGGILCPSCKEIHGRCHDTIYPLMYMADRTGDSRYLQAAKKLFAWGANMLCDDGSIYNDAQNEWNGITVFNAISLCDALTLHGHLLEPAEREAWEERLKGYGNWLYHNLDGHLPTNINYFATNACAMALLGAYFKKPEYQALAARLMHSAEEHLTENGLLFGEGSPNDARTPKGCRPIDVGGYNVEESLPSLCRCAEISGDAEALRIFTESFRAHLKWMLPDGAWDNSVGTRNFKWTYWGSRTSDGCQEALFALGSREPVFAEAAWRNLKLYERCTSGGLLHGGPDYARMGELPCVHHSFCHAKALAGALDRGLYSFMRQKLPADDPPALKYYPELDTYRLARGGWCADITAYDFVYMPGGHASGGTVSLLFHKACGPLIAVGAVDYSLHEVHNQQLSLKKRLHRSVCPRIEAEIGGIRYGQQYDLDAKLKAEQTANAVCVHVDAALCTPSREKLSENGACTLDYMLTDDAFYIRGTVAAALAGSAAYILPITEAGQVQILKGRRCGEPVPVFSLDPGLLCREYRVCPDPEGVFALCIRI